MYVCINYLRLSGGKFVLVQVAIGPMLMVRYPEHSLDFQHDFLVTVTGGSPIHESIPKDRLYSIADVATGTGYVDGSPDLTRAAVKEHHLHHFSQLCSLIAPSV